MRKYVFLSLIGIAASLQAQSLRFTSGEVTNYNDVTLTLQGPTNQTCQLERLDRSSQVWEVVGTNTLDASGIATFDTTLSEGIYGFYRSRTTSGATYLSTNAFGAVAGYLYTGSSMIGNPFGAKDISEIILEPADSTTVYKWNNASNTYDEVCYDFGEWNTTLSVGTAEGIRVYVPTTNALRYLVSGLISTNYAISKDIPAGLSMLCTPLYRLMATNTWTVDNMMTNQLGGLSNLPVETTGYNPQCAIYRMIDFQGNYQTYTLTTNNVWQTAGTNTVVPVSLTEGFWIDKPTNATWDVSINIW